MNVRQIRDGFLDFGEVIYVVDSDYRTVAQGWSRADRTGPLDLIADRPHSAEAYVFRTNDFNRSDAQTIQAAVDAAVDFRGDAILLTPGDYSANAVVNANVADLRFLGPRLNYPTGARTTWTAAVAAMLAINADRVEIGNLRLVPVTESHFVAVATGADRFYMHDFFYDSTGVTANAGTQMVLFAGTSLHCAFKNFVAFTDGAQGPLIETDGTITGLHIDGFRLVHAGDATLSIALLDIDGAASYGILVENGVGITSVVNAAVTNLITIADQTENTSPAGLVRNFWGTIGFCASNALVNQAGASAEFDIVNCGLALAGNASNPVLNADNGAACTWTQCTPYSS